MKHKAMSDVAKHKNVHLHAFSNPMVVHEKIENPIATLIQPIPRDPQMPAYHGELGFTIVRAKRFCMTLPMQQHFIES